MMTRCARSERSHWALGACRTCQSCLLFEFEIAMEMMRNSKKKPPHPHPSDPVPSFANLAGTHSVKNDVPFDYAVSAVSVGICCTLAAAASSDLPPSPPTVP